MHTEMPEVRRACFCFPLRYSLLLWAYVRLIFVAGDLYSRILYTNYSILARNIFVLAFSSTMSFLDFILVVIFIIGAHKKSVKLLKVFFIYDLSLLILITLSAGALIIRMIYTMFIVNENPRTTAWRILWVASNITSHLIIKGYILLLVRNEITKLSNNGQFKFVNNGAESECKMKYQKTGDEEIGLEKSDGETFESEDKCPKTVGKLTNESECNMKLSHEEIGKENISNEETHSESQNAYLKTFGKLANKPKCDMKYKEFGDED